MSDDAWHDWRRQGIGGSDIAGILGISPWSTPWTVWADKTGRTPPRDPTESMEFGKRAEAMIGPWFHDLTGLYVAGEQTWCSHPDNRWARCTVDGFVSDCRPPDYGSEGGPDFLGVLEIKTEGKPTPWNVIPAHYQAQAQWAMYVTGLPVVWFAVLHARKFRTYTLDRDEADIAFIVDRADRFRRDHIEPDIPPPVDGTGPTTDTLAALYPDDDGTGTEVPAELVHAVANARANVKAAQAVEKAASNALRAAMGEHTTALVDGQPAATWKAQERRGVDIEAMEAEHLELVERYRTVTVSRVLRLTNRKQEP